VLGYTPPKPMFWKALLTVAPLVALVSWSLHLIHIVLPTPVLVGCALLAWLVIAAGVHARVSNDWRTQWAIGVDTVDYRTHRTDE